MSEFSIEAKTKELIVANKKIQNSMKTLIEDVAEVQQIANSIEGHKSNINLLVNNVPEVINSIEKSYLKIDQVVTQLEFIIDQAPELLKAHTEKLKALKEVDTEAVIKNLRASVEKKKDGA